MAEAVRRCRPLLGTFVTIEAAGGGVGAIERAFASVALVHERMSFHSEASDLALLRNLSWGSRVAVAPETVAVLRFAKELHGATAGLFDVTVAAQLVALGFLPRPPGVDLPELDGTSADIEIEDDSHVRCHRPLLIDLGGIAKGYAVDQAVGSLLLDGTAEGIVDAGGDLRTFGPTPRAIAIRDGDGQIRSGFRAAELSVATSSNRIGRRRRSGVGITPHLDARRRCILRDESVTVLAETCLVADAFTKVAMADRAMAGRLLSAYGGALFEAMPIAHAA